MAEANHTLSPYSFPSNSPLTVSDPTGADGKDPYQAAQAAECPTCPAGSFLQPTEVHAYRSGASREWKEFLSALGDDGFKAVKEQLVRDEVARYSDAMGAGIYGRGADGNVNVPQYVKDRIDDDYVMATLKYQYARVTAGYDPNSFTQHFIPLHWAAYMVQRASIVSSYREGVEVIRETSINLALQYVSRMSMRIPAVAAESAVAESAAGSAAKGGLALENSVTKVMGNSYKAMGEVSVPIKNAELLNSLNAASKGNWVKVYEAGMQNGAKIEMHYFRNNTTQQVFDVKTKYDYWHQKSFKKIGE